MDPEPDTLERYGPLGAIVILVSLFLSHNAIQGAALRKCLDTLIDKVHAGNTLLEVIKDRLTTRRPSD